ncbi:midasin-like [Trichoplusia ni]|uniref:Midasin-like n=1 Tax=Trichoplusia ni TaxID=7111 RepID=A0A7E5VKC5_TRINI|nr:midasin-like [Trichoplusia ni]
MKIHHAQNPQEDMHFRMLYTCTVTQFSNKSAQSKSEKVFQEILEEKWEMNIKKIMNKKNNEEGAITDAEHIDQTSENALSEEHIEIVGEGQIESGKEDRFSFEGLAVQGTESDEGIEGNSNQEIKNIFGEQFQSELNSQNDNNEIVSTEENITITNEAHIPNCEGDLQPNSEFCNVQQNTGGDMSQNTAVWEMDIKKTTNKKLIDESGIEQTTFDNDDKSVENKEIVSEVSNEYNNEDRFGSDGLTMPEIERDGGVEDNLEVEKISEVGSQPNKTDATIKDVSLDLHTQQIIDEIVSSEGEIVSDNEAHKENKNYENSEESTYDQIQQNEVYTAENSQYENKDQLNNLRDNEECLECDGNIKDSSEANPKRGHIESKCACTCKNKNKSKNQEFVIQTTEEEEEICREEIEVSNEGNIEKADSENNKDLTDGQKKLETDSTEINVIMIQQNSEKGNLQNSYPNKEEIIEEYSELNRTENIQAENTNEPEHNRYKNTQQNKQQRNVKNFIKLNWIQEIKNKNEKKIKDRQQHSKEANKNQQRIDEVIKTDDININQSKPQQNYELENVDMSSQRVVKKDENKDDWISLQNDIVVSEIHEDTIQPDNEGSFVTESIPRQDKEPEEDLDLYKKESKDDWISLQNDKVVSETNEDTIQPNNEGNFVTESIPRQDKEPEEDLDLYKKESKDDWISLQNDKVVSETNEDTIQPNNEGNFVTESIPRQDKEPEEDLDLYNKESKDDWISLQNDIVVSETNEDIIQVNNDGNFVTENIQRQDEEPEEDTDLYNKESKEDWINLQKDVVVSEIQEDIIQVNNGGNFVTESIKRQEEKPEEDIDLHNKESKEDWISLQKDVVISGIDASTSTQRQNEKDKEDINNQVSKESKDSWIKLQMDVVVNEIQDGDIQLNVEENTKDNPDNSIRKHIKLNSAKKVKNKDDDDMDRSNEGYFEYPNDDEMQILQDQIISSDNIEKYSKEKKENNGANIYEKGD